MWRFSRVPIAPVRRRRLKRWARSAPVQHRSGPGPAGWVHRLRCSYNWYCPVSWWMVEPTGRCHRHRYRRHLRPILAMSACWTMRLARCAHGSSFRCPRLLLKVHQTSPLCSAQVSNRPAVSSLCVCTWKKNKTTSIRHLDGWCCAFNALKTPKMQYKTH